SGEALVEEVQTDWLRYAYDAKLHADRLIMERLTTRMREAEGATTADEGNAQAAVQGLRYGGAEIDPVAMREYFDEVLHTHIPIWDEALLTAVIDFVVRELGLRTIYYHDFDCGCRLKNISRRLPPRHLYSRLPARFCFRRTDTPPAFLEDSPTRTFRTLKRAGGLRFWRLSL
ncbi:MAG: hypothetical protein D6773_06015, partial [Alphaproteobacteria bacterium]